MTNKTKKRLGIVGGVLVAVVLLVWLVVWMVNRSPSFDGNSVELAVAAPVEVVSGSQDSVAIVVRNQERVALEDVLVQVAYPESFSPQSSTPGSQDDAFLNWSNVRLEPEQEWTIDLTGTFVDVPGAGVPFSVSLDYTPENVSSSFRKEASATTAISSAGLALQTTVPESVIVGQEVVYEVLLKNQEDQARDDAALVVELPAAFELTSSEPALDGDTWAVPLLAPEEDFTAELRGTFTGSVGSEQRFVTSVGVFAADGEVSLQDAREDLVRIVEVGAQLDLSVNGSPEAVPVRPGEDVALSLLVENTGSEPLRDAEVRVACESEGPFVTEETLEVDRGEVEAGSASRQTFLFSPETRSDLDELAPGDSLELSAFFSVFDGVDGSRSVALPNDRTVSCSPSLVAQRGDGTDEALSAEAARVEVSGDALGFPIATSALLSARVLPLSQDALEVLPPRVGEPVTLRVEVGVEATTSRIQASEVTIELPRGVRIDDVRQPSAGGVAQSGNRLVWDLGLLPVGSTANPLPQTLVFDVRVTPTQDQVGGPLTLLSTVSFFGQDAHSSLDIVTQLQEPLSTRGLEDASGNGVGNVAPAGQAGRGN